MSRTLSTLGVALLVILSVATAPASAALLGDDTTDTPQIATYGADGDPSFIVEFSGDGADDLRLWANASADRTLVRIDNGSNTALVAAPSWQVRGGLLDRVMAGSVSAITTEKLAARSYVNDVHPNYVLSLAEPVQSLQNRSDYDAPNTDILNELPTSGIAFDSDANVTTASEANDIVGADNVSAVGEGEVVAPIDTGCNVADSPGLIFGNGSANSTMRIHNASKNFITNESVNVSTGDFAPIEDGNGHGSWVASAMAANYSNTRWDGAAPNASVLCLKALNDDGSGETDDIRRAIRYAADNGADVISMSIGSPVRSGALVDAIDYAREQGSVVVVAAGNSRQTRSPGIGSPADTEGAIAVAATNGSPNGNAAVAYFSQYSGRQASDGAVTNPEQVDLAAPGMRVRVKAATVSGTVRNQTLSGTSMATPYVSVSALLVRDAHPAWSVNQTESWLMNSARPIPHAAEHEVGHGMVAVDRAIDRVETQETQTEVRTDAAQARDRYYSTITGDRFFSIFDFGS